MAEYTLYCVAQSGNAYKAALMLELAGADWTPVFVDVMKGATHEPAWHGEMNVMGELPVLDHGALRLSQSGVILDYLADKLGRFGPRNEAERREILRWLLFDNHKFTGNIAPYRVQRHFMQVGETPVVEYLRGRMHHALAVLERHLAEREWVVGERLSIADISLCAYLFWEDEIGIDWTTSYPAIARWLEAIRAQPRWQPAHALMPGQPRPAGEAG